MEPELREKIKEWDKAMTPESAKRILIRNGAMEAYKSDNLKPAVDNVLAEVNSAITVLQMTKAEVGGLIGALENARLILASFAQGLQIEYANEVEPKLRTKREQEKLEKKSPKKPADLGIDMTALMAALADFKKAKGSGETLAFETETPTPKANPNKYICDNCKSEVWNAMKSMHKC
jgi:hypothetical protein